jgi:aerobic C4-dicarboxylate transport protein
MSDIWGRRVRILKQLWLQVLLGMAAGALLGWLDPKLGAQMKPFGDAFIALVRMLIGPVIFCTVVHGIAGMNDMRRVGRVAVKTLAYFEAVTTVALALALAAVNLLKPGAGMNVDPRALDTSELAQYVGPAQHLGLSDYLLHIIPNTLASAFTQPDVLPVLLVSLLAAFALVGLGERGRPILGAIEAGAQVIFRIVGFVMWAAPIGAFGAIAFTIGKFGAGALLSLGALILEFYAVSLVFVVAVLGAVAWRAGVNIFRLMAYIREELLIVAATTSSETVLPRLIQKLEALGCEESVVGLVVPTGYSFNLDGTCLYLATAAVFLAQATNTPLGMAQQLGLLAVLLLTSKGAAGVAGAAFVVLAATLGSTGAVPVAAVALILGIHRLMAEALTFVNVVGNCVATVVVARWEKAVDPAVLKGKVGFGPPSREREATA